MKRLGRWTLNTLTALSLLLCVVVLVAHCRIIRLGLWQLSAAGGRLRADSFVLERRSARPAPNFTYAGFGIEVRAWHDGAAGITPRTFSSYHRTAEFPVWPVAFLVVLPVCGVAARRWKWFKEPPPNPHPCPRCSYDLTGNISGVCPECGTAIVKGGA